MQSLTVQNLMFSPTPELWSLLPPTNFPNYILNTVSYGLFKSSVLAVPPPIILWKLTLSQDIIHALFNVMLRSYSFQFNTTSFPVFDICMYRYIHIYTHIQILRLREMPLTLPLSSFNPWLWCSICSNSLSARMTLWQASGHVIYFSHRPP